MTTSERSGPSGVDWGETSTGRPRDGTIHEQFEAQVRRAPEAVALEIGAAHLTYRELDERANQLAWHLRRRGVGPDVPVGICMERSLELVVGILGILKAGGAYVPLDPDHPAGRIAFLLEDTRARVVLTQGRLVERLPPGAHEVIALDLDWPAIDGESVELPPRGADADTESLAYIMYTSGSTGKPKGVCVPHRGVVRLARGADGLELGPRDVFLLLAPIAFDASTFELWGSLLNGSKLAIFPPGPPSLEAIGRGIERHGVSTLWLTTGLFHQMVDTQLEGLRRVRQLLTGGDVVSPTHARRVLATLGERRLYNLYGPTENTTFTTCHAMTAGSRIDETVPIGRPVPGTRVYVLDRSMRPVPVGVAGELYAGGDGLARGYLNQPELTRERFVPDPFDFKPGSRLYRTGDRVRYRDDGTLEFLGRFDHQLKIRGFRIEPGEIETVLGEHAAVSQSVVIARHDESGDKQLVAYVVARDGAMPSPDELRGHLAARLPAHMVPSALVLLEELPLTANSKLDREALPAPDRDEERPAASYTAPRTETEAALAEIWATVLGRKRIGVHETFFDLGGHSLLATRMVSRIRTRLDLEIPLAEIFENPTIDRLAAVIDATRISRLPPLNDAERHELHRSNEEGAAEPVDVRERELLVHELFEARVESTPEAVAIEFEGEELTYLELNERANRLARDLRAHGVGPEILVGISMERSPELIVGVLAILKAGGAYVPLDPEWPRRRLEFLVRETRLSLLVTSSRFFEALRDLGPDVLRLDPDPIDTNGADEPDAASPDWRTRAGHDLEPLAGAADLAYVMYTSGSTGQPKGVAVPHGALRNYVRWATNEYTSPESRDFALFTSVALDLTVTSIYVPLASGGRIVIYGEDTAGSDPAILRVIEEDRVDIVKATPSHLALVKGVGSPSSRLGTLIVGGEELKTELAASLTAAFDGGLTIYNEYGPTEATVGCMVHAFDRDIDDGASVPIGVPIDNTRIYLLDDALRPVPVGVTGQIYVSGDGIAREYLNRPDLTAERFLADPFLVGARMYRTGDLARWRSDGIAVFLGREDRQLKRRASELAAAAPSALTTREVDPPLSFSQQRMWFLDRLEPGNPFYNIPFALRLTGALDTRALEHGLRDLILRHETLRTTLHPRGTRVVQVIDEEAHLELRVVDLGGLHGGRDGGDRDDEMRRLIAEEAQRPFDLQRGPLLRASLLKLAEREHVLLLTLHHIIFDGWSIEILMRELSDLYGARLRGETASLPELPIQYADFAIWQRQWLTGEVLERQLAYWKHALRGLPSLQLPTDRPRPSSQSYHGARETRLLSPRLGNDIAVLARREGATLSMTLLAAFNALLHRYTHEEDLVVGSPIAGRNRQETEGLIGCFINTLVLRTDVSGDPSFRELLGRVREVALGAYEHQDLPFEKLVEELGPERDHSRNPLFQVLFSFQNAPRTSWDLPGLTPSRIEVNIRTTHLDLEVAISASDDGLGVRCVYATDLFEAETIQRLLAHFERLLEEIVAAPDRSISELPLLGEEERRRVLQEWNDTAVPYPRDATVHQLFAAQAERTPGAIALEHAAERLTYRELDARSSQLARYLRGKGVAPEVLVGIAVERGLEMVVGILGILKAGGAYVPLDPDYPRERLDFMLRDAAAPVLLTQSHLLERLPAGAEHVVCLDRDWPLIAEESDAALPSLARADNLAYVIYTSGSTGRPKGVAIEHRSACALVDWATGVFSPGELSGVLFSTSICFDLSVFEMFVPLSRGGSVIVAGNALELPALPARDRVTLVNTVPSAMTELLGAGHLPRSVRTVNLAGERLTTQLVGRIYEEPSVDRVYDLFGPSEDTTYSTFALRAAGGPCTVGRPIANTQVYLLDAKMNPVPVGVPGEMYLGGAGLARGYLNRPELTDERFVASPFSGTPGARLYRTGDLARYLPDGNIEFLGRMDHQVKVRGFRIELGEIETVLARHEGVRQAVVLVREDHADDPRLTAYFTSKDGRDVPAPELRRFLGKHLPGYMVPSSFLRLDAVPLTPNGKIDRRALPAPEVGDKPSTEDHVAPRTEIEAMLAAIWAEVLEVERVGITDNFFELGGHSLLATRVISRIRELLKVELPLVELFESRTISELALTIRGSKEVVAPPVVPTARDLDPPLSFCQQRMWFLDQLEPESPFYNIPFALRLTGALDTRALEHGLRDLILRHETLRTTLHPRGTRVVQVIDEEARLELRVVDLGDDGDQDEEVRRLINEEAQRPFDLQRGPLLRASLLRLGEREHVFLLTLHHIIFDGWSIEILMRELSDLYGARLDGETASLPELPIQYADFAIWQREWLTGEVLERQLAYWKHALRGLPSLQLPTDRPRPSSQSYHGARETRLLSPRLGNDIAVLARREGATLSMTLLAAFNALLHRYTHEEDLVVGSPIAGRNRQETEGLIGCFINTLVLRTDVSGDPSFRELLGRVREVALGAYEHQDLPFEKLVEELGPERDLARNPLFQVLFSFQNAPRTSWDLPGLTPSPMEVNIRTTHLDLEVAVSASDDGLALRCLYATDLFEAETIQRLLGHFERLLEEIVAAPDRSVSELPLLGEEERRRVLEEWNDTAVPYPRDVTVHQLFAAQAERTPGAVALEHAAERLTYRELDARSSQLARYLRGKGVAPEVLVGIAVERGLEMVVGILGILKAGGAYVPLDPDYPRERLDFMLRDAAAPVLLTQSHLLERLPAGAEHVVCLDRDWPLIDAESDVALPSAANAENLAYVIYTSGSTGRPKGVQIPHRALSNFLFSMRREPGLQQEDALLAVTTLSFDIAALELYLPLVVGARIVLAGRDVAADGVALSRLLADSGATVLQATPATWRMLLRSGWRPSSRLKMLCGGEELPLSLARQLLSSDGELWNLYGPTETTIWSTIARIRPRPDARVTIGRPIAGTRIYILDARGQPVPVGVPGELHIAGDGLARGYLDRPALTSEAFVHSTLPEEPGGTLYRTGDLARYLADGAIEFLGRIDHQVKIRGFRIEPGEIEVALESHQDVEQAIVTTRRTSSGEKTLVAHIISRAGTPPTLGDLRRFVLASLPSYMVPAEFYLTDALPLTPNGKIDRGAVARMEGARAGRVTTGAPHVPPRSALEKQLAKLWGEVLGERTIGVRDSFFELGGNSIEAAILFSKIESALGARLPLAMLFRASTIEELAVVIERDSAATSWESVVPIQPGGTRPPLFCMHGAGGNVLLYRRLAHHLGPEQPVHGLQSRGLDGREPPLTRIEDMAARYVREIKAVQPEGPYFLAGYCMGGAIAYEVAGQLLARGDAVGLLAFFETYNPASVRGERTRSRRIRSLIQNVKFHLENISLLDPKGKLQFLREKASVARRRIRRALRAKWTGVTRRPKARRDDGDASHLSLTKINDQANASYQPRPYPGDVLLFRPSRSFSGQEDPDFGWRDLVGGELETITLPVYPRGMLTEPFVRTLAARLGDHIDRKHGQLAASVEEA